MQIKKIKDKPTNGDSKIKLRFALIPTRIGDFIVWGEFYETLYVFVETAYVFEGKSFIVGKWIKLSKRCR